MLSTILFNVLLCNFGGSAFKMGNVRMQTTVTRYCNLDLVGHDGKPVSCHISNAMETMGLVLPGMDDGKSLTTRQDVFVTKESELTVEASPARPYEYTVMVQTEADASPGLQQVVHKRVIAKLNGTDPQTGMNYTALAMTGLIPNSWTLYTDVNDNRIVKLLATNTLFNDKVFQETNVTHWEELPENMTVHGMFQLVYSTYDIKKHSENTPRRDPVTEGILVDSEVTGEITRELFRDAKRPD
ncbi:hypothetical protein FOL47_007376 [Perkinsus chesapeaki]|uniref:Uncharacterized protein n=1 Tax=Perkinsus chesapeaki TaxID=330153 RepID=A0A7J6LL84_PERCH|nr:hypothetical protein FOL47_007376 [Perkinsus chesapeaki]